MEVTRPEALCATIVRTIGGGSEVDLAGDNLATGGSGNDGTVKALASGTGEGGASETTDAGGLETFTFQFLDEPNTTSACVYTVGLKDADADDDTANAFILNSNNDGVTNAIHAIRTFSMISAQEIPQ